MWVDADGNGGFKHSMGMRPRFIIVHAGGVAGWISKSDLILRAKKSLDGDYHNELNAEHLLEWFELQLCPIFLQAHRSSLTKHLIIKLRWIRFREKMR